MKITSICLLLLCFCTPVAQAADSVESVSQRFVGDYELVSFVSFPADGGEIERNYIGRLSYDAFGNMSGLGMPRDLPERDAAEPEPVTGGFAYWGEVSFDTAKGIVFHHVKGSPMVPQWVGGDNVRYYEFVGDELLKLSLKDPAGRITGTLTWRRLK
jgi:hypothetical protein